VGFSADIFQQELRTQRLGRACRVVAEAHSTIDLAWVWLRDGGPDGGVVLAEKQIRARGRLGRRWVSPDGGLWLSLMARPGLPVSYAGRLGIAVALAAAAAVVEETGAAARVKWPNDVLLSGRKLGGVLVETEVAEETVSAAVLSLGLNVNVDLGALPVEVREVAMSLSEATGRTWSLEKLAARACEHLERGWPLLSEARSGLVEKWQQMDALAGERVAVNLGATPGGLEMEVRGVNAGIDEAGALILETEAGSRRVASGEVRLLREAAV
jgi:BirA family biotin operon repressor/biotin-[acetyl-CoA-carboxylase] ligase